MSPFQVVLCGGFGLCMLGREQPSKVYTVFGNMGRQGYEYRRTKLCLIFHSDFGSFAYIPRVKLLDRMIVQLLIVEEPPYCFPWWLYQLTFLPTVYQGSVFSTS